LVETEIIDVHLHAMYEQVPPVQLPEGIRTHQTYDDYKKSTFLILEKYKIRAVTSGEYTAEWKKENPNRIIRGLDHCVDGHPCPDHIKDQLENGELEIVGELAFPQYLGIAPGAPEVDTYLTHSEAYDKPICLHMGLAFRGTPYLFSDKYRAGLSNPLLLEDALVRHPKLRIWLAHAGWPMLDEMVNMLWTYPQLHVDVSAIDWMIPRREFYSYLQRLVDAGLCDQVMYGSDQMMWPDTILYSIKAVKEAEFLSSEQRQDILFNNAVKFLRLENG
jgi:predicted TIM-barrel fold metal-dependent hydrolase